MQDGIIKGTGNSRYLKSIAAFLAQYPTYEAFAAALAAGTLPVDLNGINEDGWQQLGTVLNKASLLRDSTAALYGLDADAVPDDVLAYLGQYNLHTWKLTQVITTRIYTETVSTPSYITVPAGMTYNGSEILQTWTVQYSNSYSFDETTGSFTLTSPSQFTYNWNDAAEKMELLRGKYFKIVDGPYSFSNFVMGYCQSDMVVDQHTGNNHTYFLQLKTGASGVANKTYKPGYTDTSEDVPPQFVTSLNDDEYQEGTTTETVGNVTTQSTYEYLGIPFQNAITPVKVEVGSYVGTGTYGSSNPNSLTFGFKPKIWGWYASSSNNNTYINYMIGYSFPFGINTRSGSSNIYISYVDSTVSWYHTGSASNQNNSVGTIYYYYAIG